MVDKGTDRLGNKRTSEDHPNNNFIKIGQNTEKSPGDSRRFSVTDIPVRNHRLTQKSNDNSALGSVI